MKAKVYHIHDNSNHQWLFSFQNGNSLVIKKNYRSGLSLSLVDTREFFEKIKKDAIPTKFAPIPIKWEIDEMGEIDIHKGEEIKVCASFDGSWTGHEVGKILLATDPYRGISCRIKFYSHIGKHIKESDKDSDHWPRVGDEYCFFYFNPNDPSKKFKGDIMRVKYRYEELEIEKIREKL